jgi:hypothetical protein
VKWIPIVGSGSHPSILHTWNTQPYRHATLVLWRLRQPRWNGTNACILSRIVLSRPSCNLSCFRDLHGCHASSSTITISTPVPSLLWPRHNALRVADGLTDCTSNAQYTSSSSIHPGFKTSWICSQPVGEPGVLLRVSPDSLLAMSHATTVANLFLARACTVTADQRRQHLLSVRSSFLSMPDLLSLRMLAASVGDFRCY